MQEASSLCEILPSNPASASNLLIRSRGLQNRDCRMLRGLTSRAAEIGGHYKAGHVPILGPDGTAMKNGRQAKPEPHPSPNPNGYPLAPKPYKPKPPPPPNEPLEATCVDTGVVAMWELPPEPPDESVTHYIDAGFFFVQGCASRSKLAQDLVC